MNKDAKKPARKELDAWVKKQLESAVHKLLKQGVIDSLIVEAKPAWTLPFQILIGKIRPHKQAKDFEWFICGEVPTDFLASNLAATPRQAARHFSMQWQLAAAQYQEQQADEAAGTTAQTPDGDPGAHLCEQAEALYDLAADDRL